MEQVIAPLCLLSGSGQDSLRDQLRTSMQAVLDAQNVLCANGPHPRDYYLIPGLYKKARKQHERRQAVLAGLIQELKQEFHYVDEPESYDPWRMV